MKFKPTYALKCKLCEEVIYSRYSGEFRWCKCKSIAIDQTEHYSRVMGNIEDIEEIENFKVED